MNNSLFSHFMPYCVEVEYSGASSLVAFKNRGYETVFKVSTELNLTRRKLESVGTKAENSKSGGLRLFLYESNPEYGETDFDKSDRFIEYYLRLNRLLRILDDVIPVGSFTLDYQ